MAEPSPTMTLNEAAEHLGVHYMTAYRYVRLGKLPAVKEGSTWKVDGADVEALLGPADPVPDGRPKKRTDWSARFEDRILAGDESGAWSVIEAALASGLDPSSTYLEVIGPALRNVGSAWEAGAIDIAQEHRATRISTRTIGRLGPRFSSRGRRRGTVVLGTSAGDAHGLGTTMVADLLRSANFQVDDMGANVPPASFVFAAEQANRLVGVGISAFMSDNDDAIMATIEALREVTDALILVGGPAIAGDTHATRLGADGFAADGAAAVERFLAAGQ